MKILGVTSCPTGIAHTYMAAEALEDAAKSKGYEMKVETRGSVGVDNELTDEDINNAEAIILAVDTSVPMERFKGKKVLKVSVSEAIKNTNSLLERAKEAPYYYGEEESEVKKEAKTGQEDNKRGAYRHLMNGVSFMIPFVVAGGIAIAISFIFGYDAFEIEGTLPFYLMQIGGGAGAFGLMVPILAGYIAYSIADRPGLAPGMIGGLIAVQLDSGFLGGIAAGFLAGYLVVLIKRVIKLPKTLQGIMPILIIPVLGSIGVGLILFYIIGAPVAVINTAMQNFLVGLEGTNAALLGLVIGLMMAFDMGGPVNKAAYAFGAGTITAGVASMPMAAVMAAGMVPPLGVALATTVFSNRFNEAQKEAGKASWVLGASFITEGAIPFAAADPFRVIPSIMIGSAVTGALSMLFGSALSVPHGGIFVVWAVTNPWAYLLAILIGTIIAGCLIGFLKRPVHKEVE
jgi:PTS system fructose-specific IIC component